MLLDYLEGIDVQNRQFLELGCGTATQACRAVQKGAVGHASDITLASCKNARLNADQNDIDLNVYQSDIFDQIPPEQEFDLIFVNPPFISKYPEHDRDFAFCCGEQYEYYEYLFRDLRHRLKVGGKLIMALAKSCNCSKIESMAKDANFEFRKVDKCKKYAETNYLFEISRPSSE